MIDLQGPEYGEIRFHPKKLLFGEDFDGIGGSGMKPIQPEGGASE